MRLVLAEDNALLRDGLIRLLEANDFTIVAAVDNAPALDQALTDPTADAAVVDVRMPPSFTDEGLRAAITAREARPGFPVLVLSQYVEQLYARELLSTGQGAVGYLFLSRRRDPPERLTAREREVLALMAEGRSNAAIAAALFVTEKAVAKHTNSIFTKLDLPVAADDNRRVLAVLSWLKVMPEGPAPS